MKILRKLKRYGLISFAVVLCLLLDDSQEDFDETA